MTTFLQRFAEELQAPEPLPERLALLVAGIAYPDLDVEQYLGRLDQLAATVESRLPGDLTGKARAQALLNVLADEMGFRGNAGDYYDPDNSFLNRVLDRRLGLPITLSLLYMAVGRRLDLWLEGMGFPGHFMLRYVDEAGAWLLDPFHGQLVDSDQISAYLARILDQPVVLNTSVSDYRVTTRVLLLRILNNLRGVYLTGQAYRRALQVLNYMVLLTPENAELWRERGVLHFYRHQLLGAENDLRRYFSRRGRLELFMEPNDLVEPVEATPSREEQDILDVLNQIRVEISRLN